ncbi:MAG TPA: hypothetical protein VHF47_14400 [Acidimicrobiales bacterium]|nr:hypothetical protein [Acidimicrobiales bacterium]
MAKATATQAPSHATRCAIVQATNRGVELEQEVETFAVHAREAGDAFTEDVGPLGLSDEHYELVASASGLAGLFDLVERMRETLAEATAA